MSYNGWSNRETWLVNLWFEPESLEDLDMIKYSLEDDYDSIQNSCLKDMINLSSIDWRELEEHIEE